MATTLQLEVVTPDRSVIDTAADYVGVPGISGQFGVLAGHVPLISALAPGELYFRKDGQQTSLFISGGFAEVSDNRVSILAESAELAENIDVDRALRARERAEGRLVSQTEDVDLVRAQASLKRAITRLSLRGIE